MALTITGIYKITNSVNGKCYVGSASRFHKRWYEHLKSLCEGRHHSIVMQRAFDKYGQASFKFEKLLICKKEDLIFYEQRALDVYKPEYNICKTAGSVLGMRHSAATKEAARKRALGNTNRRGKKMSEEFKRRVSEGRKGKGPKVYGAERIKKSADGMRKAKSVMDEEKVREVRRLVNSGMIALDIASSVGCSHHVVYDIRRGRCFGWVI